MNGKQPTTPQKQTANHEKRNNGAQAGPSAKSRQPFSSISDYLHGAGNSPGSTPGNSQCVAGPDAIADPFLRKIEEDNARCHYRDSLGRRCRNLRVKGDPTYCIYHARRRQERAEGVEGPDPRPLVNQLGLPVELFEELMGPLENLRSATAINYLLGRLLVLRAARLVSTRDAALFAYICQLLLQSHPLVNKEIQAANLPGPENDELRRLLDLTTFVIRPRRADQNPPPQNAGGETESIEVDRQ